MSATSRFLRPVPTRMRWQAEAFQVWSDGEHVGSITRAHGSDHWTARSGGMEGNYSTRQAAAEAVVEFQSRASR